MTFRKDYELIFRITAYSNYSKNVNLINITCINKYIVSTLTFKIDVNRESNHRSIASWVWKCHCA